MIRLYGIPISDEDARNIVTSVIADGSHDSLEAGSRIWRALEIRAAVVVLSVEQRDAILATLEDVGSEGSASSAAGAASAPSVRAAQHRRRA